MRPSLTTADAAQRIGTNDQHVRKLCREDRIPHYRVGGLYRFDPDELDAWLAASHVTVGGDAA